MMRSPGTTWRGATLRPESAKEPPQLSVLVRSEDPVVQRADERVGDHVDLSERRFNLRLEHGVVDSDLRGRELLA
ncbi:MAG: hypothetical protein IV100_32910 [Myxococcales bacterium]|nr:hypothetical protein [Myxococcales bacterium]